MPTIQLNGTEIFYEEKGEGEEVIVFLNGIAMTTDSWIYQTNHFKKKYRVLLHDFRGQGKSSLVPKDFTFDQHAADLMMLLEYLNIDKVHVVGVSYGAEVGMYFALNHPERLKTLTLGTAVSEIEPLLQGMAESWISAAKTYQGEHFFKVMAPLVYSNSFYKEKGDWLKKRGKIFGKMATREWFEAFIALCENFLTLNVTHRLKEMKLPTLILAGGDDILKDPRYSQIIHQEMVDSQLMVIPEGGHALFLEKPNEFNRAIMDFIS